VVVVVVVVFFLFLLAYFPLMKTELYSVELLEFLLCVWEAFP